jgi:hypothetical protein
MALRLEVGVPVSLVCRIIAKRIQQLREEQSHLVVLASVRVSRCPGIRGHTGKGLSGESAFKKKGGGANTSKKLTLVKN